MTDAKKRLLVFALSLVMFLGAMDVTIVNIAGPHIAEALAGFDTMSFLFSSYTLLSSVTIPIYGKLADLYGRKRILLIGSIIFVVGSLLCGLSPNMPFLIASRAIQGAGVGAIFTLVNTIVGDIFPLEVRGKVMGAIGTVWGIASIVGPFVGGILLDLLSWHWIFLINVPLGVAALLILQLTYREEFEARRAGFDFAGALTLGLAVLALLLCFNSFEIEVDTSGHAALAGAAILRVVGFAALAVAALVAFVFIERRAERRVGSEAIVPRVVLTRSALTINAVTFVSSFVMMGSGIYLPIYLQNVLGQSAFVAGLLFVPQSLAWLLTSFTLGAALIRFGARRTLIVASLLVLLAYGIYCLLTASTPVLVVGLMIAFSGFGLGGVMNATLLTVQESVGRENRGAAVGFNSMLRSIGQAIGAGLYGGIFNAEMARALGASGVDGIALGNPYASTIGGAPVSGEVVLAAFSSALFVVFVVLAVFALVTLLCTFLIPHGDVRRQEGGDARRQSAPE